jgi:hypothetical protein
MLNIYEEVQEASNPLTPSERLGYLYYNSISPLGEYIFSNPNSPTWLLLSDALFDNPNINLPALGNNSILEVWEVLDVHPLFEINNAVLQRKLARHSLTPTPLLEVIKEEKQFHEFLLMNPCCPLDVILEHPEMWSELLSNTQTKATTIEFIYQNLDLLNSLATIKTYSFSKAVSKDEYVNTLLKFISWHVNTPDSIRSAINNTQTA